ncbi:unnamed protein product [Caenorhabditis bovis]|uniref:Transthyretin-like family protein n=1 Tax=Caenorhabditis bovis TaxID=2654633 RepID=A0A8S1E555_9PELO|nr:unnamed protein product [Caenorhabditis bovis]
MAIISVAILALLVHAIYGLDTAVSVRIRGRLLCEGKPMIFFPIELVEKNILFADTVVKRGETDGDGYFDISGTIDDWFVGPSPYFHVAHQCYGDTQNILSYCHKEFYIYFLREFQNPPNSFSKIYDLGTREMKSDVHIWNCIF